MKKFPEENHDMDLDDVNILHKVSNWKKRCVAATYYIIKNSRVLMK